MRRAQGYVPKIKSGHVAPGVTLGQLKDRLSQVQGALVDMPMVSRLHCRPE
jgi:phospholipase D1/2